MERQSSCGQEQGKEKIEEQDHFSDLLDKYLEMETALFNFSKGKTIIHIGIEWKHVVKMIASTESLVMEILKEDFVYAVKKNIDQRFWHAAVHQYNDLNRKLLKLNPTKKELLGKVMSKVLDRGINFFDSVLSWIEKKYPIIWNPSNGTAMFKGRRREPESSECALKCYIRILVVLGDAHRYSSTKFMYLRTAIEHYEKAKRMDPSKGRIFYQMAVVTRQRNDFVSTAYNLTRANIAPVSVPDSRDRLLELYDDVYKVHRKVQNSYWYAKGNKLETKDRRGVRKQVWVFTMGPKVPIPDLPEDPHTKDVHFQNITFQEAYDRFAICYVNYIGKLYTHIGLELLNEAAEESLVYFERLFHNMSKGIPSLRLVQVLTLNMYMLDRLSPPISTKSDNFKTKFDFKMLNMIQFAMEMFGIMVDRLSRLIECCDWDNPLMESTCIGVQIWCSWMQMNTRLWARPRPRPSFAVKRLHLTIWQNKREPEDDIWFSFANLISNLEPVMFKFTKTLFASVSETPDNLHTECISPLPECTNLAGLAIFSESSLFSHVYYTAKNGVMRRSENFVRMRNIHKFGSEFLFQTDFRILTREPNQDGTYSYTNLVQVGETRKIEELCGVDESHYHFWTLNYNYVPPLEVEFEGVRKPDCNNSRLILRRKKRRNPYKIVFPKRPRMPNYEVWLYYSDRRFRTEILVQPVRLVMDTNCFVQKLSYIQRLISLVTRPIYVPVTVILELRGLTRGGLNRKDWKVYGSRFNPAAKDKLIENMDTADKAETALAYIANNMKYFYIITATGKILNVRSPYVYVRDNIYDPKMTNDDRILDTCKYLETADYRTRTKDSPRRIYRKTLLITGDRNLRLKCSVLDIPTRHVTSMVLWFYSSLYPDFYANLVESERRWRKENGYYEKRKLYYQKKREYLRKKNQRKVRHS